MRLSSAVLTSGLILAPAALGAVCDTSVHEPGYVSAWETIACSSVEAAQDWTEECKASNCSCYLLTVESAYAATTTAHLKVNLSRPGTANRGTVLMMAGGCGAGLWQHLEAFEDGDPPLTALKRLNNMGFTTVQVTFREENGWCQGIEGSEPGFSAMASRPAAVIQWTYDTLHQGGALVLTANSGGSSAFGYALTHYGLWSIVDVAVLTAGPVHGDMVGGCCLGDPMYEWRENQRDAIDLGYRLGNQPCLNGDPAYLEAFAADGVLSSDPRACYSYPETRVRFLSGTEDPGNGPDHQLLVYEAMLATGTDTQRMVLDGVGHTVPGYNAGAQQVTSQIDMNCPR